MANGYWRVRLSPGLTAYVAAIILRRFFQVPQIDVERGAGRLRSMHLVPGAEADLIILAVCTGTAIRIQLVRKCACRADAFFLLWASAQNAAESG